MFRRHSITFLVFIAGTVLARTYADPQCSGTASGVVVYEDTQIRRVVWNGVNQVSSVAVGTPFTPSTRLPFGNDRETCAGESGIVDYVSSNLLFPAATLNSLYTFSTDTGQWSDIDVYCKPVGVAYGYDIVGFCEVDNASPTPCVPYFKVQWRNGQWTDRSGRGLCSYPLTSTNLTNPVILSYDDPYGYSVKLYIAEQETSVLHEIDLGGQQSRGRYNIPRVGDHQLKVGRTVPAVAEDESLTGLRIELFVESSPYSIYHVLFSSTTQQFTQTNIQTETIAFDSYNLDYLVSFTTNLRTMIVSFRNGTTRQYPLTVTLDDPIRCENMVGPDSHYLICLAGNGLNPVIINVANGTSRTIPIGESPVTKLRTLNKNMFYLLNSHQELSLYLIDSSNVVHIGTYTVHSNSDFTLMGFSSNISCNFNHATAIGGNDTISRNQTGTTNDTSNLSVENENTGEIEPTDMPANETDPTVNTDSTDTTGSNTVENNATSHPSNSGNIKESSDTGGPNTFDEIIISLVSALIVALIVSIGVTTIFVIRRRRRCHLSKKLEYSYDVILPSKDDNSSQQDGKDILKQPDNKTQSDLDITGSKSTSVQRSLSFTGGTDKSENFVTYIDSDHESTKSPLPCSDGATSMAPLPESRIGPDGTDRYMN